MSVILSQMNDFAKRWYRTTSGGNAARGEDVERSQPGKPGKNTVGTAMCGKARPRPRGTAGDGDFTD
jgi:hypothetical protein